MRKITKITLGILLTSISLFADIQFDLHAQHFSKAIEGKYAGARYELTDSYVSTNLAYIDGAYITQNSSGYFNVEVQEAKADWSVSLDAYYRLYSSGKYRVIKLVSENGESIMVSFAYQNIQFNGEKVFNPSSYSRITTTVTQVGESIKLFINGGEVGVADRKTFGNLKYVEVQLISENNGNDRLNSLTIGSK